MKESAYAAIGVKRTKSGLVYFRKNGKDGSRSKFAGIYGRLKEERAKRMYA